jgi:hypothetical protein
MSFVYLSDYAEYVGRLEAKVQIDYLPLFINDNQQSGTPSYHFIINPFKASMINNDVY